MGRIQVELGDHSLFPLAYYQGRFPKKADEMALSQLEAEELNKKLGDKLEIQIGGEKRSFTITGLYSDISNGGKTGKLSISDPKSPSLGASLSLKLKDGVDLEKKIQDYQKIHPQVKLYATREYRDQVFGSTLEAVHRLSIISLLLSGALTCFLSMLFTKMQLTGDRRAIASMKAIGISAKKIKRIYYSISLLLGLLSLILGLVLTLTLGKALAGLLLSIFGVSHFQFVANPLYTALFSPLFHCLSLYIGSKIALKSLDHIQISQTIKE